MFLSQKCLRDSYVAYFNISSRQRFIRIFFILYFHEKKKKKIKRSFGQYNKASIRTFRRQSEEMRNLNHDTIMARRTDDRQKWYLKESEAQNRLTEEVKNRNYWYPKNKTHL